MQVLKRTTKYTDARLKATKVKPSSIDHLWKVKKILVFMSLRSVFFVVSMSSVRAKINMPLFIKKMK